MGVEEVVAPADMEAMGAMAAQAGRAAGDAAGVARQVVLVAPAVQAARVVREALRRYRPRRLFRTWERFRFLMAVILME